MSKNIENILKKVIGPFDNNCSSSGVTPGNYYVTAPLISIGTIKAEHTQMLDNILAFDKAEASFANITQTNMITVSSFNGPNGAIIGYDFLKEDKKRHELLDENLYPNIYDASPLFKATKSLFGTVEHKRYPIMPGEHLLCAYKSLSVKGPCVIYGALGIGIPHDRSANADLFMEDHGVLPPSIYEQNNLFNQNILDKLIKSINRISENIKVPYKEIFVGIKACTIDNDEVGCVITAAPYIHLPKKMVPEGVDITDLANMSLFDWEMKMEKELMRLEI